MGQFGQAKRAFYDLYRRNYARSQRLVTRLTHKLPWFIHKRRRLALIRLLGEKYDYIPPLDPKKLLVAIVARDAVVSPRSSLFIRLISPLTQPLLRDKVSFLLYPENTTQFPESDGVDICIVQRTAFDDEKRAKLLVKNLRERGIRLVVDTDDAFHLIEQSHPEYRTQLHRATALERLIDVADQVWLSVPSLAENYLDTRDTIKVVPNGLDKRIWYPKHATAQKETQHDTPIQILYMGTVSHDEDFEMILPALEETARAYPDSFELTIIGVVQELPSKPWLRRLEQPKTIYPLFVEWFLGQGPFDIGLSPLVDSAFNGAKSDIKCLDYLAAGIVPVVSNVLPYQSRELDGCIIRVDNTTDDWVKAMAAIVADPKKFHRTKSKIIPKAQKYLWSKRSSNQTAEQLDKLLSLLNS